MPNDNLFSVLLRAVIEIMSVIIRLRINRPLGDNWRTVPPPNVRSQRYEPSHWSRYHVRD